MNTLEQKRAVGKYAATLIENGMVVGLGTGSTVKFFVEELGRRVNEEGLDIVGVTTSTRTAEQARTLGIALADVDDVDHIDITVDGADVVDAQLNGIKGGGAALLYEKVVAKNSRRNVWIVDASKVHEALGHFPLPVEVVTYGAEQLCRVFDNHGLHPVLRRTADGEPVKTDNGNEIVDLHLDTIPFPSELANWLANQVGVIEHGLFLNVADEVIVGGDEIQVLKSPALMY